MRFHADGPNIPDSLLERCDAGRVVFLCGAGVSLPSGMPSFVGLTKCMINFFHPPKDSEIMRAFQPWIDDPTGSNMPLDQVFNLLHQEYGKDEVNALVTGRLQAPNDAEDVGYKHGLIKRISSSPNGIPQIVTTNFDRLFELGDNIGFHVPPAFPDLAFGTSIEGITYLHGRLADADARHHPYVLSSADFGRAYLSEAWATNFIRTLLERYTVVLVGYQAEDPPIKYLLQGLNHDGQNDRSRLFAFDRETPEGIEAKWHDRGVTAIAYADHKHLWQTMEAWAERADSPRAWRKSVIEVTQHDPKVLLAHQRGQVAHVLKTVPGAKLLTEAQPPAHPEWVCVMDATIRSAKEDRGYGDDSETFDPRTAYGLDDDQQHISEEDRPRGVTNDHLLVWRHDDENPSDAHRLGGRQAEGNETVPTRLWHLIKWISKNVHSPALAWWAIRQNGLLHPRLLQHVEWQIAQMPDLHDQARHTWNLIIEHHKDPRNRQWNGDWFDLKTRIAAEGWTASVLRYFSRICFPRIEIKPPYSLGGSHPPSRDWGELSLGDLGLFEVKFLDRHKEDLPVPDYMLPQVLGLLQHGMIAASGMLADIGTVNFTTPTCYPEREVDGDVKHPDAEEVITLFIELFDRLTDHSPDIALGYVLTWPEDDKFIFRKLKLYALSKSALFPPDEVAERLLALDQSVFWDTDVSRELVFLMVDRWATFTDDQRAELGERILTGPDKKTYWSDEEYPSIRDEFAARYARYLELQGCALSVDQSTRLVGITSSIEGWNDGWATSIVTERGFHYGQGGTDETPDVLDLPVDEIVTRAKEDLERDFGSSTDKRPFTGLVKARPSRALSALTIAGKKNDFPIDFWSALIDNFPDDISPRLRRVLLHRLTRLPHAVVKELRHTLGWWVEKTLVGILEFDQNLGWSVFDHIVDGIINGGPEAAESGLGEVRQGGKIVQQSRRTYGHAINGPLGMCAAALFQAVLGEKKEAGSLIPMHIKTRVERLFAAPGEGSDHAVSITTSKLNWLMLVDPIWTEERLVPMLAFEHPAAEPAWNGFLHSERFPWSPLAHLIKPILLKLFPWVERQHWDRDLSREAAQWLGNMCICNKDKLDGLTNNEMRTVLRSMSDDTRNRFIFWLGQVGQGNDDDWNGLVVPFMQDVWPRERIYRTASSTNSWIALLDNTGDSFPAVYASVKQFLVPVDTERLPFYRFTRELDDETLLTAQFPEAMLDMMNTVTPSALTRPAYELPKILLVIADAAPELISDHRYLRLINLVERS